MPSIEKLLNLEDPCAPFANSARAAEIANMDTFGLEEFIELTGIGAGRYGIYELGASGVSAGATDDLEDYCGADQLRMLQASRKFSLAFPCSPKDFATWYDNTRGTNGISDFPLASGFLKVVRPESIINRASTSLPPVPSSRIMAAFRVEPDEEDNEDWWDGRMRAAKRYGLLDARVSPGRAKQPSYWDPQLVAAWLLDKSHLNSRHVLSAMADHFPEYDTDLLV